MSMKGVIACKQASFQADQDNKDALTNSHYVSSNLIGSQYVTLSLIG